MDKGKDFGPDIVSKLKSTIRQRLSARHVPSLILPIQEIPYTVNGKKVGLECNMLFNRCSNIK